MSLPLLPVRCLFPLVILAACAPAQRDAAPPVAAPGPPPSGSPLPPSPAPATPTSKPISAVGALGCVHVVDDATVAIRMVGSGPTGWSSFDMTVDLSARSIAGTLSEEKEKKVHTRALGQDEIAPLRDAFAALCLKAEISGDAAMGGGGAHYEIRERDGSIRVVGYKDCAPRGASYFPVTTRVGYGLGELYPSPDKKRVPPTNEAATRSFIEQLMFGTPFGPRDAEWSFARLDPKGELFKFETLPGDGPGARFEITPKRADLLRVRELAKELDVDQPIAYQVNGEHDIWELGDGKTKSPIRKWRLGEIEVRLTMPPGTHGAGYSGSITKVDGAAIDFIIVQTKE